HVGRLELRRSSGRRRRGDSRGHRCDRVLLVRRLERGPSHGGRQRDRDGGRIQRVADLQFLSEGQPVKAIKELLRDRRRAQRGSVLSGVLIMTAFIAILSGALTTELSTNFLLSHNLVTKVGNQATVDSALELTLSRLQSTPISQGCPSPASATLNGRPAPASIIGCAPTVDSRSRQFTGLVQTSGFSTEGVHAVLPAVGLNEYLVGDSSGVRQGFPFGSTSGWPFSLGGAITAPPLAMLDPSGSTDVSILVPTSNPTLNGGCGGTYCLALLSSDSGSAPAFRCYLATGNV